MTHPQPPAARVLAQKRPRSPASPDEVEAAAVEGVDAAPSHRAPRTFQRNLNACVCAGKLQRKVKQTCFWGPLLSCLDQIARKKNSGNKLCTAIAQGTAVTSQRWTHRNRNLSLGPNAGSMLAHEKKTCPQACS